MNHELTSISSDIDRAFNYCCHSMWLRRIKHSFFFRRFCWGLYYISGKVEVKRVNWIREDEKKDEDGRTKLFGAIMSFMLILNISWWWQIYGMLLCLRCTMVCVYFSFSSLFFGSKTSQDLFFVSSWIIFEWIYKKCLVPRLLDIHIH